MQWQVRDTTLISEMNDGHADGAARTDREVQAVDSTRSDEQGEDAEQTRDDSGVDGDIGVMDDGDDTSRTDNESGDHGVTPLSTDRIELEALESLFTERTDDGEDDERDEIAHTLAEDEAGDDGAGETAVRDRDDRSLDTFIRGGDASSDNNDVAPKTDYMNEDTIGAAPREHEPLQPSRALTPDRAAEGGLPPSQPKPTVPARPQRPTALPVATANVPSIHGTHSSHEAPLHVITFDVGGKLFRCKASLIRKYPEKRLCHVISCGCEQLGHDTFFIDRNPQHFEVFLDWYRTGKSVRPPTCNEEAFREDARYFDLVDELFPSSTPLSQAPVPECAVLPRLPERPARLVPATPTAEKLHERPVATLSTPSTPVTPTQVEKPRARMHELDGDVMRFQKRELRVLTTSERPVWYAVRTHEHLVVDSVRGSGKLLVRVCDPTGMARTFVERAVLFDSRSWFYLRDGWAKLQHCVLPGGHVYSFWMEPHTDASPTKPSAGGAASVTRPTEFEVEFRIISSFERVDALPSGDVELASILQAKGSGWGDGLASPPGAPPSCLFLPPSPSASIVNPKAAPAQANGDRTSKNADASYSERDAIAEQILAQTAKYRAQKAAAEALVGAAPVSNPPQAHAPVPSPSAALKRNGAAIARAGKAAADPRVHGGERVTVFQPDKSLLGVVATPHEPHPPASKSASPSKGTHRSAFFTDQQPRQFR